MNELASVEAQGTATTLSGGRQESVDSVESVSVVIPQVCSTCGTPQGATPAMPPARSNPASPSWVYALGHIEARFPSLAHEKEFAQAVGRDDTKGFTDRQVQHQVLSKPANRYLARQMCWVMTIEGLETYLLTPRDPADLEQLLEALRPHATGSDLTLVIGTRGPIAPPQMCNGLMVPIVVFEQIYSFSRDELIRELTQSIAKTTKLDTKALEHTAGELFDRIMLMADNAGATNYHRAVNYLIMRYPRIYEAVAEAFARDESLTGIDVRPSALSGTQQIVEVILSFTNRNTDVVTQQFVRVNVDGMFPFLVTKLSPYYSR
jgi:hypothetical protein